MNIPEEVITYILDALVDEEVGKNYTNTIIIKYKKRRKQKYIIKSSIKIIAIITVVTATIYGYFLCK